MPITTNAEALADMQRLRPTSTGRLRGRPATPAWSEPVDRLLRGTPEPWRSRVAADLTDRRAGILTPASAEYLVWSDNLLIVVLTAAAQVELPDYPLTALQRRHQAAVVQALTDLPRDTLRQLADQRTIMDGRDEPARLATTTLDATAIRVAPAGQPTVTAWVTLGPSLADSRRNLQTAGIDPDRVLILSAPGYGRYGERRHRLDLPTLCTMCRLAVAHDLPVAVIGDWLDDEGATTTNPSVARLRTQFAASYLGVFRDQRAYIEHHMTELGWTVALAEAGIPIGYLDLGKISRDWFADEVRAVRINPGGHIAVFSRSDRRHPPRPGAGMSTSFDVADRFQQAVDRDDGADSRRALPDDVLVGGADRHSIDDADDAAMIEALPPRQVGAVPGTQPAWSPVVDPDVIDALQYLAEWCSAGDAVDWEIAVIAYDVPADVTVQGVRVPAGLYTREVTGDGRHVIALRWTDRDALTRRVAEVDARHAASRHLTRARPGFVAAHTAEIDRYARAVIALIDADEGDGGPLYDAPVRCWLDLHDYVDANEYLDGVGVPWGADAVVADDVDGEHLVTAVQVRVDELLHDRDRPLSIEEAHAAGFGGIHPGGRGDGHTWASLTPRQRAALGLH